jgi:hypothetical protein
MMAMVTLTIDDVFSAGSVELAIVSWSQGQDGVNAGKEENADVGLNEGARIYIDSADGRTCEQVGAEITNPDALMDIGGSYYTISDWSEYSVVELEVPTIDEALERPEVARKMARAAKLTHHAESDLDGWKELIEELDEIEGASITLKSYGDMFTGGCIADAAHEWLDAGIEDDGSIGSWCDIGCWNASTAAEWIAAGLTPDDVESAAKAMQEEVSDDDMHARYSGGIIYACCNNDIDYKDVIKMHNKLQAE